MGRKLKDLTGQVFGRLTVIERAENKGKSPCWLCQCECGKKFVAYGGDLSNGKTKSCGCLHDEGNNTTHGLKHTPLYNKWCTIKARCFRPNHKNYKDYGARGITMFPAWINDFKAFYDYVSQLEHFGEKGYSLDRINNDGNYEPENVRWATRKEQTRNRRNTVLVEYNGVKMPLAEAAEKSGISYDTLKARIRYGWSEKNLFAPNQGVIHK